MIDDEDLDPDDDEVEHVDPDHPASVVQCDHPNCNQESPGFQRLCDDCDVVMHPANPDECSYCGSGL